VTVVEIGQFFEEITHRVPITLLSELWFLENLKESQKKIYGAARQALDFLFGALMGLICLLLWPVLAPLIYLQDRGPIFYKQRRVGQGGRVFTIYKFRTMRVGAENGQAQFAALNDPRVTPAGRVLRLLRLDELPQAWNLLRGDMSFIGPRPERPEFVAELQAAMPFYNIRHLIKPGLTGWAQINYHYTDSLSGNLIKLQYDLYYIKNRSLLLDLVIVLKTIPVVAKWLGR
jgi:lipopolysaccharide/colanic/teichoic acid biosynthesis glycosyltransferase